jgi:hypothetical protein
MRAGYFALLLIGIATTAAAAAPAPIMPLSGMILYHDAKLHFAIAYPPHWTVNPNFTNEALGPGKAIHGVSFTISPKRTQGTNLGADTALSVQHLASGECEAKRFQSLSDSESVVKDGDRTYSYMTAGDAAMGNRYDITIYALTGTQPCLAVEYFIHYSAYENYPPGTVKKFDRDGLIKTFDKMRRSLAVMK